MPETPSRTGLDPEVVCTLPPSGLAERRAWIASEILPHAVSSERGPDWIRVHLQDAPGLHQQLDQLVLLEQDCCGGIDFSHAPEPGGRRLEIHGIDPDAALFATVSAGTEASPRPASRARRIAKALGIGSAASLLVCCVLPVALAATLGAAAAAPFAALDRPWIIAGAALATGAAIYLWRRP